MLHFFADGETVTASRLVRNASGTFRALTPSGWVSLHARNGRRLFHICGRCTGADMPPHGPVAPDSLLLGLSAHDAEALHVSVTVRPVLLFVWY